MRECPRASLCGGSLGTLGVGVGSSSSPHSHRASMKSPARGASPGCPHTGLGTEAGARAPPRACVEAAQGPTLGRP